MKGVARLYANENFPLPVVQALRHLEHDVLTTAEAGNAGQSMPDDQVLDFATKGQRAVVTLNRRHFVRLHAQRAAHAGIVVCTYDPDAGGQARRIHDAIRGSVSLDGRLVRVNRPAT